MTTRADTQLWIRCRTPRGNRFVECSEGFQETYARVNELNRKAADNNHSAHYYFVKVKSRSHESIKQPNRVASVQR